MKNEVYGYIYLIRNLTNNKLYFGQTTTGFERRYGYNLCKNTHNEHLKNAINKYGLHNFEIIEQFDTAKSKSELDSLEDMYIKLYNTTNSKYGYNKKYGGANGCHSEETKLKIGQSVSGENNGFYGKQHTEETKQKLREANTGKKVWLGRHHSEETKQKISASKVGTQAGGNNPRANKVICLNTGQVFDCAKDGALWAGATRKNAGSSIIMCCKGKRKTSDKHPQTGEKLKWMYYEDYLNLIN